LCSLPGECAFGTQRTASRLSFQNLSNAAIPKFADFSGILRRGTRAAALSYGVLEELARTEVVWEGQKRRLLDEVDYISAVSGGSFTAAYFASTVTASSPTSRRNSSIKTFKAN